VREGQGDRYAVEKITRRAQRKSKNLSARDRLLAHKTLPYTEAIGRRQDRDNVAPGETKNERHEGTGDA